MKNIMLVLALLATAVTFTFSPLFGVILGLVVVVGLIVESNEKRQR